jgi:N4-gp56 family major capsid protein
MPVPAGTLTSTTTFTTRVATALDLEVAKYLREEPIFRPFTDSRPERQSYPGKVVTKTVRGELALATTPLSEALDVDSVAPPADRQFNITMNEYGNVLQQTNLLREVDWSQSVASEIGMELGVNATRSIDKVYQTVLDGATNVAYTNATTVVTTDPTAARGPIKSQAVSTMKTLLRRRNAEPRFGMTSACVIHPDVLHDLYAESGTNTWRQPHEQVDTSNIYNRVAGDYMGVRFIENSNCTIVDGGANPELYTTYFIDKEALIEVVGQDIQVKVAPPIDALDRFFRTGWYALLGVSIFRQNAVQLLKTSSTLNTGLFSGTNPTIDGKA